MNSIEKLAMEDTPASRQRGPEEPLLHKRVGLPVIIRYLLVLLRRRWAIIGVIAACLIAGLVITLLTTPLYKATSRVQISRTEVNVTNVQGVEPDQVGANVEFYQTQYALLGADSLAQRVARKLNLNQRGAGPGNAAAGSGQQQLGHAVSTLRNGISIKPVRGSSLVDITFTSTSPQLAADVANTWAEQFIATTIDRRYSSTADARRFLEQRLGELRQRVEQSERALVAYAQQRGIVTLASGTDANGTQNSNRTLVSDKLEALNRSLTQATADRISAESALSQGPVDSASPDSSSGATMSALRQRRAEVASEYAKLLAQFKPDYPVALALKQQLASLDQAIVLEVGRGKQDLRTTYEVAKTREAELKSQVDQLKAELISQRGDAIQYNIYQRDADTNRELYNALLQRYKEIGVAGVGATNIAIVDQAKVPRKPASPDLFMNMLLALFVGIALSTIVVFALEQLDQGFDDPQDLSATLNLPLLGVVPNIGEEDILGQVRDPRSAISEAYMTIQSSLAFATSHGFPHTLLVTSARESEGKSITSASLAGLLARLGFSTLLIDADMRSPSVHLFMQVSNDRGLSHFLSGEDDWQAMVKTAPALGVHVLSAGMRPPSAAELLSSGRMERLIKAAAERYAYVIVDAPPVLDLSDAPLLARLVEGCVFIVAAKGTPLRRAKSALDRLLEAQVKVFGAVVTRVKQTGLTGYGYGYGYGYGHSYGKVDEE